MWSDASKRVSEIKGVFEEYYKKIPKFPLSEREIKTRLTFTEISLVYVDDMLEAVKRGDKPRVSSMMGGFNKISEAMKRMLLEDQEFLHITRG